MNSGREAREYWETLVDERQRAGQPISQGWKRGNHVSTGGHTWPTNHFVVVVDGLGAWVRTENGPRQYLKEGDGASWDAGEWFEYGSEAENDTEMLWAAVEAWVPPLAAFSAGRGGS